MARSAAEKAALEMLEAAIEHHADVWYKEHPECPRGTLVDWVIISAEIKPDMEDSDNDQTTYGLIYRGGSMPWYRARGLMQAGIGRLDDGDDEA